MTDNSSDVSEWFNLLESNKAKDVDEIKKIFHEQFLSHKDNWLVNGLFDYYLNTNSPRAIEVLVGVREPHDKYLLDRLSESLAKPASLDQREQCISFLNLVARQQPTWLHKLSQHQLFRELLKLLKVETNMISLMGALLLLVTLLPMLPATLGPFLNEIFEVYGRLASLHYQQSSSFVRINSASTNGLEIEQVYLLHLQISLNSLFDRLYAMYPCNFISYLKQQYLQKDQNQVFKHTIKPMLDSVRMHPLLITMTKDAEIAPARWKKIQHHDIVAECEKFTLERNTREEVMTPHAPPRHFTPIPDPTFSHNTPTPSGQLNEDEDIFWSPSMYVSPNSPPPLNTAPESRSTPSTPNTNRSRTSPPEAAVEATPETTPVKDLRMASQRPLGSSAVRALGGFGNGTLSVNSRPTTPSTDSSNAIVAQKLSKIMSERQNLNSIRQKSALSITDDEDKSHDDWVTVIHQQNGKNEFSCQEDQEIAAISAQNDKKSQRNLQRAFQTIESLSKQIRRKYSRTTPSTFSKMRQRSKSCSDLNKSESCEKSCTSYKARGDQKLAKGCKLSTEDATTQTISLQCDNWMTADGSGKVSRQSSDSRLTPTAFLDKYIESCVKANSSDGTNKSKIRHKLKSKKSSDEMESTEDGPEDDNSDVHCVYQHLQLMQLQLQFERQRREVHAERNRRLLGKLRDSRSLEEHTKALTNRIKMLETEIESLKNNLEKTKKDSLNTEEKHLEALRYWQKQCMEEQKQNKLLGDQVEALRIELKNEQKKMIDCERQLNTAEAALCEAAHQLKGALKAASQTDEIKRVLDSVQKKYLLLGEIHTKVQERTVGPVHMARTENTLLQRAYSEELTGLRRQLESQTTEIKALRSRLSELESRDANKEVQLVEEQRRLQEVKERHEAELAAVESKYTAQMQINLFLESRILELHGILENATSRRGGAASAAINLASSASSPKERSPPLSVSLASSSEGSLAYMQSAATPGIVMNDCCNTTGEIANLQAIVEPNQQINSPESV